VRELSLFSGAGGGLLGSKLLGWTTIGYVEYEEYCQKVIKQRIADGILDEAPIFGDIRAFIDQGYADSYKGMVDVVTGGFPWQPFSVAGKGAGELDERNMWPATIEVIRRVGPQFVLLENVPGLLAHEYYGQIIGQLSESGYDARWKVISAGELGAPHKRDRLWIVATDSKCSGLQGGKCQPNHTIQKREGWLDEFEGLVRKERELAIPTGKAGGVSDGVAHRMDRLKAIGNGQVPAVVAATWEILTGRH
jgi:DNA (cytosine-5)-methyltransferase 1